MYINLLDFHPKRRDKIFSEPIHIIYDPEILNWTKNLKIYPKFVNIRREKLKEKMKQLV